MLGGYVIRTFSGTQGPVLRVYLETSSDSYRKQRASILDSILPVLVLKLLDVAVEVFLQVFISVIAALGDEVEQAAGFGNVAWRSYFK